MFRRVFASLSRRLVALVILCSLPGFLLILYDAWSNCRLETARAKRDVERLVKLIGADHERLIQDARFFLRILTELPAMRNLDAKEAGIILTELQKSNPAYCMTGLVSAEGMLIASSKPFPPETAYTDRDWFVRVHESKDFVAGEYTIGRVTNRPSLPCVSPILAEDGNIQAILLASIDLTRLDNSAAAAQLPEGSTVAIMDRQGTVLLRQPDPEKWLGRADSKLLEAIRQKEEIFQMTGPDSVLRLYAFAPLGGTPEPSIYVSVGIPCDELFARTRNVLLGLVWLGSLLLVILVATLFLGDAFVLGPVRRLLKTVREVAQGNLNVRIGPPYGGELGGLSHAFDQMAESLQQRAVRQQQTELELRRGEEYFRRTFDESPLGKAIVSLDYKFERVNKALCEMTGYTEEELRAKLVTDIVHSDDLDISIALYRRLISGAMDQCQIIKRFFRKGGGVVWVRVSIRLLRDPDGQPLHLLPAVEDITARRKAQEEIRLDKIRFEALFSLSQMSQASTREILDFALEQLLAATRSRIGFIGFIDNENSISDVYGWSRTVMKDCKLAGHPLHYSIDSAGVWAKCLKDRRPAVINDYSAPDPDKKGYPEGHVPLSRLLSVPIFDEDRIVMVALLGNKEEEYDSEDIRQVNLLIGAVWRLIQRKKADEALRESEAKYRRLIETLQEGIWVFDEKGCTTFANGGMAHMLGYGPGEMTGKPLAAFLADESGGAAEDYFERRRRGIREQLDLTLMRKDGTPVFAVLETGPIMDEEGRYTGAIASVMDVSERKQAEEIIRRKESYFRSLLSNMYEDIFVIDRNYEIRDANKEFLSTLNRRRDEIIGKHCHEVFYKLDTPCGTCGRECLLHGVFEDGQPRTSRCEFKIDGSQFWADVLLSPLKDADGNITQVIKAVRDVTPEVKLETQIQRAQKLEAIGTLAGGIAHDFNNILGVILGYTEMTILRLPDGSREKNNLNTVVQACERAKDVIKQILTFSRAQEKERRPLHIEPILKETIRFLRTALPATIQVSEKIDLTGPDGDVVVADPAQIHQVLMNLCTNSGHAMREKGGSLEVRLTEVTILPHDPEKDLDAGPYVRISVSDTGQGMDKATMERIFEPYFTTKEPGEGTGLGLSVVHGIARQHKGTVTVYSEKGIGTVFNVYLPRVEESREGTEKAENTASPRGSESILLIDDEEDLIRLGKQMLEYLGYRVTAISDAVKALNAFLENPDGYDLVITDQTMPSITGLELADKLLKIRPGLPIILCTGFSEKATPEKARAAGIRQVVPKPLHLNEMAGLLRKILNPAPTLQ